MDSITKLKPNTTALDIKKAIDGMKMGCYPFDYKKGIQNVFKALSLTEVCPYTPEQIKDAKRNMAGFNSPGNWFDMKWKHLLQ